MLTIPGPRSQTCDGMSRRSCLRIGGLALGGLALPEILRVEAKQTRSVSEEAAVGGRSTAKGIIMVLRPQYLVGEHRPLPELIG